MLKKICPKCKNPSYSSDDREWRCPKCGRLLNDIEAEPASQDCREDNISHNSSQNRSSVLAKYLNEKKRSKKGDDKDA